MYVATEWLLELKESAIMNSSMINKIAKAKRYAEEPERIQFTSFEANFQGENDVHTTRYADGEWQCTCRFFHDWGRLLPYDGNATYTRRDYSRGISSWSSLRIRHRPSRALILACLGVLSPSYPR